MESTVTERWTLPPISCQPWCEYQDGHADVVHRVDQRCFTRDRRVDLTLHPVVMETYTLENGTDARDIGPDHIEINAHQAGDDRYPRVVIRRESDDTPVIQWSFTPGEAQQLVEALQSVLGEIGEGR